MPPRRKERHPFDEGIAAPPPLGSSGGVDAPMFEAVFDSIRGIAGESFVDGPPAERRIEIDPRRASEKVKSFALHLGAKRAGTGPLRPEWTYERVGRSFGNADDFAPWGEPIDLSAHPHAVAFLVPMDERLLRSAPEFPVLLATARAYADAAWIAIRIAEYIRGLGWSARAHHLYNYRALLVPVAVDCGLGEPSRAGLLLNRDLGLGCRIGLVTTEMPLAHDGPLRGGIRSFCERYRICAERCPSGAIPKGEEVLWKGTRKWKLDEERCYRYWFRKGTDCGICLASCPWTKPDNILHRAAARIAAVRGPHQGWMAREARRPIRSDGRFSPLGFSGREPERRSSASSPPRGRGEPSGSPPFFSALRRPRRRFSTFFTPPGDRRSARVMTKAPPVVIFR